jgi:gas vesicle protein
MHEEDLEEELPPGGEFNTTSFLTGILVGAAVGAGIALLFAPASGDDTRRLIRRRARSVGKEVSHGWATAKDEARRQFKDKKEALRERLAQGLDRVEDALDV